MKKQNLFGLIALLIITILSSCSIEKRVHLAGYHVEWNSFKKKTPIANYSNDNIEKIDSRDELNNVEIASNQNQPIFSDASEELKSMEQSMTVSKLNLNEDKINPSRNYLAPIDEECDILTMKNGNELLVKVQDITLYEIRYKNCNNPNGPLITVAKEKVFSIKYPNGSKDVFDDQDNRTSSENKSSGDRSQIIAIVLCLLLGIMGIHRMYLGYVGLGILFFLTAGFCGIGVIVDIILLLTGSLKPKNGKYNDSIF